MSYFVEKIASETGYSSAPGKTVLITGISGFVGNHVTEEFLSNGYNVIGTVRSKATEEKVKRIFSKYENRLSVAIVPDVAAPGAHDEVVKHVDGVIHTASPFAWQVDDNEEQLLKPAINGTKNVLESIKAYNQQIKRVVITSSYAAMLDLSKGARPGHIYSELDWNPVTYDEAKSGPSAVAYCASKTFAEQLAWDFVREQKPNFTVSTILPPIIYGPSNNSPDLNNLNESSADIYRLMNGSLQEVPPDTFYLFVDVRDVAKAHRLAYEKEEAAGQRYFVTPGNFTYYDVCNILQNFPEIKDRVPVLGSKPTQEVYGGDSSKARTDLGITFTPLEKTITDMAKQFIILENET